MPFPLQYNLTTLEPLCQLYANLHELCNKIDDLRRSGATTSYVSMQPPVAMVWQGSKPLQHRLSPDRGTPFKFSFQTYHVNS